MGDGRQTTHLGDIAHYARERLNATGSDLPNWVREALPPLRQAISVPSETHTRIHRYRHGQTELVAFERNIDYHMSEELKQAGGNEKLERPEEVTATLRHPRHVYDLRSRVYLGALSDIHFKLDPWRPSLFLLADAPEEGARVLRDLETSVVYPK